MAGSPAKTMNGARAQIMVGSKIIGFISGMTINVALDTQDVYVCGRTGPAEIGYVAAEPVTGNINGWHIVDHGAYAELGMPTVQDLLTSPYTNLAVFDRVTGKRVGKIVDVRLGGFSTGYQARANSELGIPYKGIMYGDETATNSESAEVASFP